MPAASPWRWRSSSRPRIWCRPRAAEAAVSLDPDGGGLKIANSALSLVADVPGLDQATFDKLAQLAGKGCPVSKLSSAEITPAKALK